MKRVLFLCVVLCGIFSSCSSKVEEVKTETNGNVESFVLLKSELMDLNSSMSITSVGCTTKAPWKYIIVGAADAAGAFFGGFWGAIAASELAVKVIELSKGTSYGFSSEHELIKSVLPEEISLKCVDGMGKVHNLIVLSLYKKYGENLFTFTNAQISDLIAKELEDVTGIGNNAMKLTAEQGVIVDYIVDSYISSSTVDEFIGKLKRLCSNKVETEILDVIQVIFEGYSSIDVIEDEGKYERSVEKIIVSSDISEKSKQVLLDVSSVANASQRLWNISALY